MTVMSHEEAADLLGAYALDAVDLDEASAVRAHVAQCPRCTAELAEHHSVMALWANAGGDAPSELWNRIADALPAPDPSPAPVELASRRRRPPATLSRWGAWVAAVAAAAVIVVLGLQVSHLNSRVGQLDAASQRAGLSQAVQAALLDPAATRVTLTSASSNTAVAQLVVLPSGNAYLVNDRLPTLGSAQTYQLWGTVGTRVVSLGLLGNHPADVAFRVDPSSQVSVFAVTAEKAGGVTQPTQAPVASST